MESSMMADQSMFINFDHLLDDIYNDVQSNDDALLDQVLEELSANSCQESLLTHEELHDLGLPDLSELPLEDFTNLELYLNEMDVDIDNEEINVQQSQKLSLQNNDFDIEDVIEDISNQSSPSTCQENEFNNLLDSMFDSDFMQEFLAHESANIKVSDAATHSETIEVIEPTNEAFIKVGSKRNSDSVDLDNSFNAKKCIKDEKVVPLRIRENETEKEAIRRVKNNEASKITRAKRKQKHGELFKQQTELEKSNAELKIKIEVMQKEAEILRKVLVSKLSNCKELKI